jgi:hypothetical protein
MESDSKKKFPISLKFLAIAGLLGVVAFFSAPKVMTYILYLEERAKAKAPAEKREVPTERPVLNAVQ